MEKSKATLLEDRLIRFGVKVVLLAESLPKSDFGIKMCDQLSRVPALLLLKCMEKHAQQSQVKILSIK